MKKITLSALLIVLCFSGAQAQIAAGSTVLGGNLSYFRGLSQDKTLTTSIDEQQYRNVSFAPRVGYFMADNLALGIEGSLQASKTSATNADTHRYLSYAVGPFARYYKFLGEQFGLTVTAGAGYTENWDKYKWYDPSANFHARGAYAQIVPGIVYFPTPKLGIEASIGGLRYFYLSNKQERPSSFQEPAQHLVSQSFGADFGLDQFTLGASFYLGR